MNPATETHRVLLVEDLPSDAELCEREVKKVLGGCEFVRVEAREEFLAALESFCPTLIVSDFKLPCFDGLSALKLAQQAAPETPFIILTGSMNEDTAVECMKAGAWDYVIKEHIKRLGPAIQNALKQKIVRRDRMIAETALQKSEQRLREAQRLVRMGHWEYDLETRQIHWSDTVFTIYRRDPALGPPSDDEEATFYSPEDAGRLRACAKKTIETGEPYEAEASVRMPGGEVVHFLATGAPVRDSRGRITGLLGTVQDITARKLAEQRIKHLNRVLRGIRDVNQLIVREKDSQRLIDQACEILIESRGYFGAWIALAGADGGPRRWAKAGGADAFGTFAHLLEQGLWPPCRATADGSSGAIVIESETTCGSCPLREQHVGQKALVVTLRQGDRAYGMLGVSTLGSNAIDPEEKSLIEEVADDIAFALFNIESESERQRTEMALRESEERFRRVFNKLHDGILVADQATRRFTLANETICQMLGYSEEEILRLGVDDIHPKEDLPSVYDAFETMLWKEAPISPSLPLKRKDNTIFQAEVSATPIVLAGKDCLVGCFRDITNRRQMEAEQKRLATAIEQAAEMIIVTDATPAIQYVNPAFEATTGYTRAEVLGQNPRFLKSGKQDDLFYQELWSTISNGRTWHGRFVNKKKDGNYYTEEATISPVRDVSGRISNYVAVQRDVTRELEIQAQLHAAQKMESVGRLAGGVAHDFNNLLSVIISYAGLAADELRESDPIRADIVEIQNAGERAAALTRRLLAFSRRQLLEPEVLCLNNVVSGIENMLHRLLGEDIDIKVHLADGLGSVMADPGQLEQVIMNLSINARDAMPQGGRLIIETANVDLDKDYADQHIAVKPGRFVMLSVTDTGTGMDETSKAHIFEPFFTTKEKGKGTGLGLATVYGIVKQSGGSIWAYSEPGRGTTFKVYLPRVDAPAADVKQRPTPRVSTGSETVLIVEDEDAVRRLAERILRSAGYKILSAASGGDALVLCEKHSGTIDLLLTDVVMPQMSGRELADRLTMARQGLKVLYMSGYTDNAIIHHGVLDPGIRFVGKPFSAAELTRKVREALEEGKATGE